MRALGGGLAERAERALDAGCDLALHCNGDRAEMEEIAAAARPISPDGSGAAGARGGDAPRSPSSSTGTKPSAGSMH